MLNRLSGFTTKIADRGHQVLFPLNLAFALVLPWTILTIRFADDHYDEAPSLHVGYLFRRTAIRVASILPGNTPRGIAPEIAFLGTLISVAVLLWLLLRILDRAPARGVLLTEFAGVTAVFAVPLLLLRLRQVLQSSLPYAPSWSVSIGKYMAVESACFVLFLLLRRKYRFTLWTIAFPLLLHCAGWSLLLWPNVTDQVFLSLYSRTSPFLYSMLAPAFFAAVFPLSVLAWILCVRRNDEHFQPPSTEISREAVAGGVCALALLMLLWVPVHHHSISNSKNLRSLKVSMQRTSCRGACFVYSVTAAGDGSVEYTGIKNVAVIGHQNSMLSPAQITQLAKGLDRINFFALEDRSFLWCFDSPGVSVSVSIDGLEKTVTSDSYCAGPRSSAQEQFVKFTYELDTLFNSRKWILPPAAAAKH